MYFGGDQCLLLVRRGSALRHPHILGTRVLQDGISLEAVWQISIRECISEHSPLTLFTEGESPRMFLRVLVKSCIDIKVMQRHTSIYCYFDFFPEVHQSKQKRTETDSTVRASLRSSSLLEVGESMENLSVSSFAARKSIPSLGISS